MKIIGITGGIGSGKSTVCRIFSDLGYAIYSADDAAKRVMIENQPLIAEMKKTFGEQVYLPDGNLNREYLREVAFGNPEMLQKLNHIVHPATRQDFIDWRAKIAQNYEKSFVLKEAAILYESGAYKDMDFVISIYAPKNIRIKRVMSRDNITEKAVLQRMNNQWADAEKMRLADYVIYNEGKMDILQQVKDFIVFFEQTTA
jgi:dephospho-CoA kinase